MTDSILLYGYNQLNYGWGFGPFHRPTPSHDQSISLTNDTMTQLYGMNRSPSHIFEPSLVSNRIHFMKKEVAPYPSPSSRCLWMAERKGGAFPPFETRSNMRKTRQEKDQNSISLRDRSSIELPDHLIERRASRRLLEKSFQTSSRSFVQPKIRPSKRRSRVRSKKRSSETSPRRRSGGQTKSCTIEWNKYEFLKSCDPIRRICPYPWVLAWQGKIHGVLDWNRNPYRLPTPISIPSSGLPSSSIVPLASEAFVPSLLNWEVLPDSQVRRLKVGWKALTNQCVPALCPSNSFYDPISNQCIPFTMQLQSSFPRELLPSYLANTPIPTFISHSRQWSLPYLFVYRHSPGLSSVPTTLTATSSEPELWITGVVPRLATDPCQVLALPSDIPVMHAYEFRQDLFGYPAALLDTRNEWIQRYRELRLQALRQPVTIATVPSSSPPPPPPPLPPNLPCTPVLDRSSLSTSPQEWANYGILTVDDANRILIETQRIAGEPILIPTSCMFRLATLQPSIDNKTAVATMVRDGVCQLLDVPDGAPPDMVGFLADRDLRTPNQVNVIAGFNPSMQLVFPHQPLSWMTTPNIPSVPNSPVQFDTLTKAQLFGHFVSPVST
jgi:hypothetical protein